MAEYIEREALLQQLEMAIECKDCPRNVDRKTYYDKCAYSEIQDICDAITEAPKADVQPVKQGHWYHNTSKYVSELDAYFIQACCSCCGRYSDKIDQYSQIMSNETCSHCGAEMRGEENG